MVIIVHFNEIKCIKNVFRSQHLLYCKTLLLLLRWDMGKVRGRFGGLVVLRVG